MFLGILLTLMQSCVIKSEYFYQSNGQINGNIEMSCGDIIRNDERFQAEIQKYKDLPREWTSIKTLNGNKKKENKSWEEKIFVKTEKEVFDKTLMKFEGLTSAEANAMMKDEVDLFIFHPLQSWDGRELILDVNRLVNAEPGRKMSVLLTQKDKAKTEEEKKLIKAIEEMEVIYILNFPKRIKNIEDEYNIIKKTGKKQVEIRINKDFYLQKIGQDKKKNEIIRIKTK